MHFIDDGTLEVKTCVNVAQSRIEKMAECIANSTAPQMAVRKPIDWLLCLCYSGQRCLRANSMTFRRLSEHNNQTTKADGKLKHRKHAFTIEMTNDEQHICRDKNEFSEAVIHTIDDFLAVGLIYRSHHSLRSHFLHFRSVCLVIFLLRNAERFKLSAMRDTLNWFRKVSSTMNIIMLDTRIVANFVTASAST
jgi:hypothetical protein